LDFNFTPTYNRRCSITGSLYEGKKEEYNGTEGKKLNPHANTPAEVKMNEINPNLACLASRSFAHVDNNTAQTIVYANVLSLHHFLTTVLEMYNL
jgi:hypothetical protein